MSASKISSGQPSQATDIAQLCELQMAQLSESLPILDAWLVCWNQLEKRRDTFAYHRSAHPQADVEIQAYLDSERWLPDNLSVLELRELSTGSSESNAYVCALGRTETHWEYLLLWTERAISQFQQDLVKDYALLLRQHLDLYQENLRQRAKIQLLEQALQRADHQLRNPLSLIRLYAETLYLGAESESQKYQADCIRQTAETISTSLSDLLYCGQQARLKQEQHDLLKLLKAVKQLLAPQVHQKQLRIEHPDHSVALTVDCWQIEQVLQNLLDNAVHFSPVGSTIAVKWQVFQQEVLITVADQGPGFEGVDMAQLFNPFYSQREGGTGLGLAIAKKIILDHQGSIWAETLPQGGAQFSIVLPR
jgi:signal transduction histidine kinase